MKISIIGLILVFIISSCSPEDISGIKENPAPDPLTIISIGPVEGRLKVEWKKYNISDFKAYHLYEIKENGDELRYSVNDSNMVSWQDSVFIGGNIFYELVLETLNKDTISTKFQYREDTPKIESANLLPPNLDLKLEWKKPTFYANIDHILLQKQEFSLDNGYYKLIDSDQIDSLSYTDAWSFVGVKTFYRLSYSNSDRALEYEIFEYQKGIELQILGILDLKFINDQLGFLIRNSQRYFRVNSKTFNTEAEADFSYDSNFAVSHDGQRLYSVFRDTIKEWNIEKLTVKRKIPTNDLIGKPLYPRKVSISNDNRFLSKFMRYESPTYYYEGIYLLDLNADSLLVSTNDAHSDPFISPNGDYFFEPYGTVGSYIYKILDEDFQYKTFLNNIFDSEFSWLREDRFVCSNENFPTELHIYYLETGYDLMRVEIGSSWTSIDGEAGENIVSGKNSSGSFIIYDIDSQKILFDIEISQNRNFFYEKNVLLRDDGFLIQLPE